MRRRHVLAWVGAAAAGAVLAWRPLARRQSRPWTDASVNGMRYKVLAPETTAGTRYPVLLYLHQLDMGDYPEALVRQVDVWFNTDTFQSRHPCIVVMPLLDQTHDPHGRTANFGGKREGGAGENGAIAALRQVLAAYPVDTDRVYVTGNSMGGMGAWAMLLSYNRLTGDKARLFAAGIPVSGADRTADPAVAAQRLWDVPIWAFHGARDPEVSPDWDRQMARLLSGRPTFRYTEYPALRHDAWDSTYTRPDVWDWLFAQGGGA